MKGTKKQGKLQVHGPRNNIKPVRKRMARMEHHEENRYSLPVVEHPLLYCHKQSIFEVCLSGQSTQAHFEQRHFLFLQIDKDNTNVDFVPCTARSNK